MDKYRTPQSVSQSVSQLERDGEGARERERKKEGETEREKEGGGERERERERDVEYGCFIFIFNRSDGCLGIFQLSSLYRKSRSCKVERVASEEKSESACVGGQRMWHHQK